MSDRIRTVTADLSRTAGDVRAAFGDLSFEQLNWKPAAKKWSVAQCLDHLIVTHSLYFPLFDKLATADAKLTLWERVSPFSGFFGRFLIKSLDPANTKPMKTTSRAYPSSSDIDRDIVARFGEHQSQLISHLETLPAEIDTSMIITSPLMGVVTYSLKDALTFLPMHCRRHFDQAKRVVAMEGFPSR
ncbi:MAG: DinB family protein [Acidobacteria bacterium]|nr:DinB family protein [Acidobacteriota bacterium]